MSDCADAARLSPDERLKEMAAILAAGISRLRQRAALPADADLGKPAECSLDGLEVPAETRLSVRVG